MFRIILSGLALCGVLSSAQAQSCDTLWYQRNAFYKSAGYCFKTSRAISAFGNAGCQYDNQNDVPLSANARASIAEITRLERLNGCQ